jgi:O-acetyl-ADP-ribose deacetylase
VRQDRCYDAGVSPGTPRAADDPSTAATGDDELTLDDLEAVAGLLPDLIRVEARPSVQRGGDRRPDGSIQMPYEDHAPEVSRVVDAIYRRHLVIDFDWGAWQPQAQRLLDPAAVATATLDQVRRLLTLHVRKERFCEGHLAQVIGSGHVSALLGRLGVLAAELRAAAGRTRLRVAEGDLTQVAADAIVNAANRALAGGGGVDGAIHRAAGPELLAACRPLAPCPTGHARLTPGFRLPARWVIHTVGPIWEGGHRHEPALLASAYRASLTLALANGCRSVAFPAISCGAYRYPIRDAAAVAVGTIRAWCDVHPGLDEVILVAYEPEVAAALRAAVRPG